MSNTKRDVICAYSLWIVYERVGLIIAVADVDEILHPVLFLLLWGSTLQTEGKHTDHKHVKKNKHSTSTQLQLWQHIHISRDNNTHIFALKFPGQLLYLPSLPVIISEGVCGVQRRSESFGDCWTWKLYLQKTWTASELSVRGTLLISRIKIDLTEEHMKIAVQDMFVITGLWLVDRVHVNIEVLISTGKHITSLKALMQPS